MNILIVEDNPSHLKLAHLVLSAAGHQVNGIEAAEQALHSIREDRPQVILIDLELPGMDGLSLVRKLKASPETKDINVVVVTAFPERYSKREALAAGCDAYLVKPINTRTLPEVMSNAGKKEEPPSA